MITCLFLFCSLSAFCQQWKFDSTSWKGYNHVLNLEFDSAHLLLSSPTTAADHYVLGLAEALELLLTEDRSKFDRFEELFDRRLKTELKHSAEDLDFLRAELNLQWAFVYLKFGHELDAARHLRQSYQLTESLRKKSPNYDAIRKTNGLLQIMIGSVPQKYNWILSLLGMEGNTVEGIRELETLKNSPSQLGLEADLLLSLCQGYIFQKPAEALFAVESVLRNSRPHRLTLFVAASLALKNSQSDAAATHLLKLNASGKSLAYAHYLEGEVYLHREEYQSAIDGYKKFLRGFNGINNIRDAAYKIALCQHLLGDPAARSSFEQAREVGANVVESDKSATRALNSNEFPHIKLTKIRYATDGGYYERARSLIAEVKDKDLSVKKHQVEFYYRKARLDQLTNRYEPAKLFFRQVIDMAENEDWYFAPNACLQLGYIFLEQGKRKEAREYFMKALTYNHHEYKNSIDSKARSALNRLKK